MDEEEYHAREYRTKRRTRASAMKGTHAGGGREGGGGGKAHTGKRRHRGPLGRRREPRVAMDCALRQTPETRQAGSSELKRNYPGTGVLRVTIYCLSQREGGSGGGEDGFNLLPGDSG